MPWQQEIADIATEYDPVTGVPYYRTIIITVPRQNGKTTLLLAVELHRALYWPTKQTILYGSTDENAAAKKLERDQWPIIDVSPLEAAVLQFTRAAGKQAIKFRNGSAIELYGQSKTAGHGRTVGLAVADEAFADIDDRRDQALMPTMTTVRDAQYWVISTAGDEQSLYLKAKVEAGRKAVLEGATSGIAYFEWSADPDDDPGDPAVWRKTLPALGHTITEEVIRAAFQTMALDEFRRAYLNIWVTSSERVISAEAWKRVCKPVDVQGSLVLGVDRNPASSMASIAISDRHGTTALGHYGVGSAGWIVPRLIELSKKHNAPVALDEITCGSFVAELEAAGVKVIKCDGRKYATACQTFMDGVRDERIKVRFDTLIDPLDAAVIAARKRPIGTDGWGWDRKDGTADISPLVSVTLAYWAAMTTPEEQTKQPPRIISLAELPE